MSCVFVAPHFIVIISAVQGSSELSNDASRPSVCPPVRLSVLFYIFDFLRTTGPNSHKLGKKHLYRRKF